MATQPVLAGYTLPHPKKDGYNEEKEYKGAWQQMAAGNFVFDAVGGANNTQVWINIEWAYISTSEKDTIKSAFDAMFAAGSATLITPENLNYTVTANPQSPKFSYAGTTKPGGVLVWNCRLSLLKAA